MSVKRFDVDIVLWHKQDAVYAYVFGERDLAAVGADAEEALDAAVGLAQRAERHGYDLDTSEREPPTVRSISIDLPVAFADGVTELSATLDVVTRAFHDGVAVFVPAAAIDFLVPNVEGLRLAAREHIAAAFELDTRLGELSNVLLDRDDGQSLTVVRKNVERLPAREQGADADEDRYETLTAVGSPLHRQLDQKDAPTAFERETEVSTLLSYLADDTERSVLLVGPPGVGKTTIFQDAVGRIIDGDAPQGIDERQVWQISGGRLMAGMRFLGQWQERVVEMVREIREAGGLLFAENLVELLEASGNEKYAEGIPGLLLPYIQSGEIVLVTELRPEQLAHVEQRQPTLLRALRHVRVESMSPAQTDTVLERVSYRLGRQHGVRLSADARQKIIEVSGRFRAVGNLPGPAVDLAERVARSHRSAGVEVADEDRPLLQPEHVLEAFASQSGLPISLLDSNAPFSIDEVRDFFEGEVFAQPEAVDSMVDLVTIIRAGLNPPERPIGSFLFLGPTGVGKTQTALTLAKYLFGSADRLLRFDMSEYQDSWSAARLVGRFQGEQGELVRRVREQPFQVLLLDEIEKAHPSVFDLLLQVMGEGRLSDALGQTVPMTGTVVIMTSNLGAGGPGSLGFGAPGGREKTQAQHYLSAVEEFFRPEFVGRIDRVIPFRSLRRETARRLARRALEQAFAREGLKRRNISVRVEDDVLNYLIRVGFDERYGARPLQQIVENTITAGLADVLSREGQLSDVELVFELVDGVPQVRIPGADPE
jgi:ATP-dependent Clp protease ATP-binding subunit ClpC